MSKQLSVELVVPVKVKVSFSSPEDLTKAELVQALGCSLLSCSHLGSISAKPVSIEYKAIKRGKHSKELGNYIEWYDLCGSFEKDVKIPLVPRFLYAVKAEPHPSQRLWMALNITEAMIKRHGINVYRPGVHLFGGLWYGTDLFNHKSYGKVLDGKYLYPNTYFRVRQVLNRQDSIARRLLK